MTVHTMGGRHGAGRARDAGATEARGEIFAFLDSDCTATPQWVERILGALGENPELGAVGGGYCHRGGGNVLAMLLRLEESFVGEYSKNHPDTVTLPGGNMAVRRHVWETSRSGKELIHLNSIASDEDTVICSDLRRAAGVRFLPELTVEHAPRSGRGYWKRHLHRGYSEATLLLNRLVSQGESSLALYGGIRLAAGSVLLAVGIAALLVAAILPDFAMPALIAGALSLLGHAALSVQYFRQIDSWNRDHPPDEMISGGQRMAMRLMLSLRTVCWGVGATAALWRHTVRRLSLWWRISISIAHFWIPGRVTKLFFFVTARCNARCDFCFYLDNVVAADQRRKTELSLDEIELMAARLGRLPYLTFSGGEPFLRRDLASIVAAFHRSAGTLWVTIPTNGSLPSDIIRTTRKILTECPSVFLTVQVSLDDLEDHHDRSRKLRGAFSNVEKTMGLLADLSGFHTNLRIQIATCYTGENHHSAARIATYCRDHYTFDQQAFYLVRERDDLITDGTAPLVPEYLAFLAENEIKEWASRRKSLWNRVIRAFWSVTYADLAEIKLKHGFIRRCHAGSKFVTLFDDGQVSPCELLPSANYGNVRDSGYDINAVIRGEFARRHRSEEIIGNKCNCEWMCAPPLNMLWDPRSYWRVLKAWIQPDRAIAEKLLTPMVSKRSAAR